MQVRIVDGNLYYRYGAILDDQLKLTRANLALKMIDDAINAYNLKGVCCGAVPASFSLFHCTEIRLHAALQI